MSNPEPRMTIDLDIPHDAAERERLRLANLCECPTCGRMHKPLGFGDPPGVAAQNKAMQAEIERLRAALRLMIEEISGLEGREGVSDSDFVEIVLALANSQRSALNHEQKSG